MRPHRTDKHAPGGDASIWRKKVRRLRKRWRKGLSGKEQKDALWHMVHS